MSDEKEVSISTINQINQRLSSAFDAGNAVQFSIAAADAVVYAETLEQINERLHDRNKSQEARIKEIELELLSIREAGDDEVDAAIQACYDCFGEIGRTLRASPHLMKLEDLLKSLRQQLREAQAEIERWEKRAEWIGSCYKDDANGKSLVIFDGTKSATYPDDAQTIAKLIDNAMQDGCDLSEGLSTTKQQIQSLQSQIDTLTAERDELVGLLKYLFQNQDLQSDRAILSDESRRIIEIVEGE